MKLYKTIGYVVCLLMLVATFTIALTSQPAMASPMNTDRIDLVSVNQEAQQEEIVISAKFPSLTGTTSNDFSFDLSLQYKGGKEAKYFDLAAVGSDQFFYSIQQSYGGTADINSIKLDPTATYPESIKVKATPNVLNPPPPGEYTINFEVTSGSLQNVQPLKITINASYGLRMATPDGVLSGQITADKDNYFTFNVTNTGTAPLERIDFTSRVRGSPPNWKITFDPERIDSIAVNATREVKVDVKPPAKTISGDYEVIVTAKPESASTSDEITLRVTALTPTIWGWVGVAVVVIVVIALIAMFMFLGRR